MTCCVGLERNGRVWLGADSASVDQESLAVDVVREAKVFTRGEFVIAFAGPWRAGQILRHAFYPNVRTDLKTDEGYMVLEVVEHIRRLFHKHGFEIEQDEESAAGGFELLIGYHGKLFKVEDDLHVERSTLPYNAIGCGSDYALGSMYTSGQYDALAPFPRLRIELALEAAAKHNAGVAPPFTVIIEGEDHALLSQVPESDGLGQVS